LVRVAPWFLDGNNIQVQDRRISEQWDHQGPRFL
jgi:hypothetical protein